jgi:maltooligosyltrehalose trehalohydrolase
MIICIQNHDQIGNRPFGRRLNHQVEPEVFRALSALLLVAPETPLLFMGQEWAASTPFLYFTDHHTELGALVTGGRRQEFSRFEAFAEAATRELIPDPQEAATFDRSCLVWPERAHRRHAGTLELYRALLGLRRHTPALRACGRLAVAELDEFGLALLRSREAGDALLLVACLRQSGTYVHGRHGPATAAARWRTVLTTEEPRFREDAGDAPSAAPEIDAGDELVIRFQRPSAVILKAE